MVNILLNVKVKKITNFYPSYMKNLKPIFILLLTLFIPLQAFAKTYTVVLNNFVFTPKNITIHPNDTVKWVDKQSTVIHDVDSDNGVSFSSPELQKGDSFSHKFPKAGKFAYHCSFHGGVGGVGMAGVVKVVAVRKR